MPIVLHDTVVLSDTAQSDVEVSDDEYQDAPEPMEDDDFFLSQTDVASRSGIQLLLPDDFGDQCLLHSGLLLVVCDSLYEYLLCLGFLC